MGNQYLKTRIVRDEKKINHPCFILLANGLNCVRPEISKRVMVFSPACRMPSDLAMKNGGMVKAIGREMGNALYREYVRLMLERLPGILSTARDSRQPPDIWALSSGICGEIFDRFNTLPQFEAQTWHDYVGQKNICDHALAACYG